MSQKTPTVLEYNRAVRDDRELSTTEKAFAYTIASHSTTSAFPGHVLLGAETATSERTSKRTVASLVAKGWLVLVKSGRGGKTTDANVYAVSIPQRAMGGTLSKGQMEQVKVPSETVQSAMGGPTNACVNAHEIPTVGKREGSPGGQARQTPQESGRDDPDDEISPYNTFYVWRAKSGSLAMFCAGDRGFDRKKVPSRAVEFCLGAEDGSQFYKYWATYDPALEDRILYLVRTYGDDEELARLSVYRSDLDDPEYRAQHEATIAAEDDARRLRDEIESYREKYVAAESMRIPVATADKFFTITIRDWRAPSGSTSFARGLTDAQILDRLPALIERVTAKYSAP